MTPNANGTVAQLSDALGTVADYEYFPGTTQLKTVMYPDGSKYKFEYNSTTVPGKVFLATVKDALDNVLETHEYDAQGRATTSEKHGGVEKYTFAYSGNASEIGTATTTVIDVLGRVTEYHFYRVHGYNIISKAVGVCGGCGGGGSEVTQYEYDDRLNLVKKTDALGRKTLYTYDAARNLTSVEERNAANATLGVRRWTHNARGQVLTYKDRADQNTLSNTAAYVYDPYGNVTSYTDAEGKTTTMTYTPAGRQLETVTDARGNTTTLGYDSQGRLATITDDLAKVTTFGYDARARITSVTNAKNETTTFTYDPHNRPKRTTFPDANYVEHTYDPAGRRTATRNERGHSTAFGYDNAYRLTSVTDPLGHAKTFGYDPMSNLTSQTDALGNTTNFAYDDFDRLKKITYPPATVGATRLEESFSYDKLGNLKTRTNTANKTTTHNYDELNRLASIVDPLGNATAFTHDLRFRLTKVKDAKNQEYDFTYDRMGRRLTETRAGTTATFAYDEAGNMTGRIDHNGNATSYAYDDLNRLTSGPLGTYTYDDLSRLLTATNAQGTVSFTYDNRGRVDTTTDVYGKVIDYDYDAAGNRILMKLDGANHTGYGYDAAGRLTSQNAYAVGYPDYITYSYDNADRLTRRAYPYIVSLTNRVTTSYYYDGMSRLTRMLDRKGNAAVLMDKVYGYDAANRIASVTEPSRTRTYVYDDAGRLTSATDSLLGNESYAYDAVGNRTASHRSASYGYGPFNRLTSTASATYAYNANGEMASRTDAGGMTSFAYDPDGRMLAATRGAQTSEYRYDALGRRVRVAEPGGVPLRYTHDGVDAISVTFEGSSLVTRNVYAPGVDQKIATRAPGSSWQEFMLQDHLGTVTASTTPGAAVTYRPPVDSFGNPDGEFTGREWDAFAGLYYYRARMYDPALGRFTSEDPIGFAGGINFYSYVNNGPVDKTDPLGLYEIDVHYYLTLYLALKTRCFSSAQAVAIANGNQLTDEDEMYSPGLGKSFVNSTYHALHEGASPGAPSPYLLQRVTVRSNNYLAFGRYMHYYQDTYSHAGFSNSFYGHASRFHYYDKTDSDPGRAMKMARGSWEEMKKFAKSNGCECDSEWTPQMEDEVWDFSRTAGSNFGALNAIDSTGSVLDFGLTNPSAYLDRKIRTLGLQRR